MKKRIGFFRPQHCAHPPASRPDTARILPLRYQCYKEAWLAEYNGTCRVPVSFT
jgi:hypothetical protein